MWSEYSCPRKQLGVNLLCLLHHYHVVRRIWQFNLLDTLCTSSYLDVRKTAHWFCVLVRSTWRRLPQSRSWRLVLLPSKRSCKLSLANEEGSFQVVVLFGVQQGASDIFVSSQPRGAHTPSTVWPETYTSRDQVLQAHGQGGSPGQLTPQMPAALMFLWARTFPSIPSRPSSCSCWVPCQHHGSIGETLCFRLRICWSSCAYPCKRNTWRILLWAANGFRRKSACHLDVQIAEPPNPFPGLGWDLAARQWKPTLICAIT